MCQVFPLGLILSFYIFEASWGHFLFVLIFYIIMYLFFYYTFEICQRQSFVSGKFRRYNQKMVNSPILNCIKPHERLCKKPQRTCSYLQLCQCLGFLTCAQAWMHGTAHEGYTNTTRVSALNTDWNKNGTCVSIVPGFSVQHSINWSIPPSLHQR